MATDTSDIALLVNENVGLLEQGITLMQTLDPDVYRRNTHTYFTSGVGKHFRHILDFYDRLVAGSESVVDYESRKRDERIETDPDYAIDVARRHAGALGQYVDADAGATVRLEVLDADGSGIVTPSSVARELAVLASHTVHHYAIIAMLLRVQDIEVDHSFGVAPSTLRYLAKHR